MHRAVFGFAALATLAAVYWKHLRIGQQDLPAYRKFVQESADLKAYNALEEAPIEQLRKGVRKDIWTIREGRRHSRIISARSELTLTQKKEKAEAVEHLQEIEGWFGPGYEIRHLTAASGRWDFPACRMTAFDLALDLEQARCIAKEARVSKNTIDLLGSFHIDHPAGRLLGEGGTIVEQNGKRTVRLEDGVLFEAAHAPFAITSMRAETELPLDTFAAFGAQEIRFFDGVEIKTASGIRAYGDTACVSKESLRLLPDPGSLCALTQGADRIDALEFFFDAKAHELLCLAPSGRLEAKKSRFDAASGRVLFEKKALRPETVILEGDVKIASHLNEKESFALADSARCSLFEKRMLLESAPGSRVLFRQQGLEVSAPTVQIHDAVQAFGDVRFFFYPEEKTSLDALFSRRS